MPSDLYRLQEKISQPRRRKKAKKLPGFAAQQQALAINKYYVRAAKKKTGR